MKVVADGVVPSLDVTAVRRQLRHYVSGEGGKGDDGVAADDGGQGTGQHGGEQHRQGAGRGAGRGGARGREQTALPPASS